MGGPGGLLSGGAPPICCMIMPLMLKAGVAMTR